MEEYSIPVHAVEVFDSNNQLIIILEKSQVFVLIKNTNENEYLLINLKLTIKGIEIHYKNSPPELLVSN